MKGVKVEGAFLPVVAPASVAPERGEEYYKNSDESLIAIARALREEYKAIIDAGLLLQIDDAFLATFYDVMVPPRYIRRLQGWAAFRIDATNEAIKGLPPDRIRYHVCWGSWNGPHTNDVAPEDIMDLILQINVGAYSLEMANPRHEHEWRVWETIKLPAGKVLLPGVVTHSDQYRRASRTGRGAHRAARQAGRARERHRVDRLRLCAGTVHPPRASVDPVGEAQVFSGGRADREQGVMVRAAFTPSARSGRALRSRSGLRPPGPPISGPRRARHRKQPGGHPDLPVRRPGR